MRRLFTAVFIISAVFAVTNVFAATITSISQNAYTIGKYTKYELTFSLSQTYTNPFDPCEIDVMVRFHQPDGTDVNIPGFYYQAYTPSGSNPETYPDSGAGAVSWKARFAPSQLGSHICDIIVKDANGTTTAANAKTFTCTESGKKGFIRVDPNQHDFLKYTNGDTRINIGQNIGWNNGGVYGWNDYLVKLHNAGANWVRLWSCTYGSDMGVALEWKPGLWGTTYFQGAGKPSLQTSLRMDRYVEIAEQNDIAIQFALQHHGQFSTTTNPDWDNNPYNSESGGFLDDPSEYFTDPCAIKLTKNKYRYIVARWGYSPAIFAWELFNEVQWTDGWNYDQSTVVSWHNTMASYIRSLDTFKHPVTTSSHGSGFENLWNLPDISLVQNHYYGNDTIRTFEQTALSLADFKKPVLMAEFGLGGNPEGTTQPEPYATQLKEGLEMHNGIWAAFFAKSSAHLWWWDNYIDPCNLYGVYTPLSIYDANENLADYNLTMAPRVISGGEAYFANPVLTDWGAISTQTVFYLQGNYFPGMGNLSQWLQGNWQTALKSDPTFNLNMPTAGSLKIHVAQVSNYGNNSLAVLVNGTIVFSSGYDNGSTNFIVSVPLSAGQQSVQVINTGDDWFNISSYEFASDGLSLLDSIGLSNNERAYIWIYDMNSQYGKIANGVFHNESIIVKGLDDGSYFVEVYATRNAGGIVATNRADSASGQLTYTLPDFSKDIAVKVRPCTPLSTPAGVSASSGNYTDHVRVTWDSALGAAAYEVWRGTQSDSSLASNLGDYASPFDDSNVIPGTTYYYWVKARNECWTSDFSSSDSGYACVVLSAPTSVYASDGSYTNKVQVTWDSVFGATGYEVWRGTDNDSSSASKLGDYASPFDDYSAIPGTTYYYWVKATSECWTSDFSSSDSGYACPIPSAPTGVSASDGAYTDRIRVTWDSVPGATGYEVWRSDFDNLALANKLGDLNRLFFDDNTVITEKSYYYWVKARNDCVAGDFGASNRGYSSAIPKAMSITKCSVTAGSKDKDKISFSGQMNPTYDDLYLTNVIQIVIGSDDMAQPHVIVVPIGNNNYKKTGKFSYSGTDADGVKKSFSLDFKTSKFSFSAQNINLSGLSCPLKVGVVITRFEVNTIVDETIVNGTKLIPINLLMGVKDSLRINKSKFTRDKKTGRITQVAVSGGFSVKSIDDANLVTKPLSVTVGSQTFTIPAGTFKNTKGKFTCAKVILSGNEIAAATFDFNKCTFTLMIKGTKITDTAGLADLNVVFGGFNESAEVLLP